MRLHIAADIGGTFTDFVVYDTSTAAFRAFKVFTTYPDRSVGLMNGLDRITRSYEAGYGDIASFAHGSTVGTNALVEMKGARCGLITTRGFRDLLELRRQKRPHVYDLQASNPVPIIERRLRKEVTERLRFDGAVVTALNEEELRNAVSELLAEKVESIVILFLHSYANAAHENRAKEIALEIAPHLDVYTSSEVSPQFREFERLSTAAVNAYIGPVIRLYLDNLRKNLADSGFRDPPLVIKCDGGVASAEDAARAAVTTIGSGPAAGVRGAMLAIEASGVDCDLITLDMGGTSTDVSLVVGGRPAVTDQREVGGWPIKGAATDIASIGAGGGSIAWVDAGGLLRVGPASAGSVPGPACYGRGGQEPTVTDANLVLGRLESLVGGEISLDKKRARKAIQDRLATPLGLSIEAAALGVLQIATTHMEEAIRLITVEKGRDPRDFVLAAFGGAGPLHASIVARNLGIEKVLIAADCGVLSAYGALVSDITKDFSATERVSFDERGAAVVAAKLLQLKDAAYGWLVKQGLDSDNARCLLSVDMRCKRQNYELNIPVDSAMIDASVETRLATITKDFHAVHERLYGYAFRDASLECVTYRVRIELASRSRKDASKPRHIDLSMPRLSPSASTVRQVLFDAAEGHVPTKVLAPRDLGLDRVAGPAIIEQADSTAVVLRGQRVRRDHADNLWIEEAANRPDWVS